MVGGGRLPTQPAEIAGQRSQKQVRAAFVSEILPHTQESKKTDIDVLCKDQQKCV